MNRLLACLSVFFFTAVLAEEMPSSAPAVARKIMITVSYDGNMDGIIPEWRSSHRLVAYNTSGKIAEVDIPINKSKEMLIPQNCDTGFISDSWPPSSAPINCSLQIGKPVPFTADMKELTIKLTKTPWTKFIIKTSKSDGNPLQRQELIVYDSSIGGLKAVARHTGYELFVPMHTNDHGEAVFYGLPGHRFILCFVNRSPFFLYKDYSEEYQAQSGQAVIKASWKIPPEPNY